MKIPLISNWLEKRSTASTTLGNPSQWLVDWMTAGSTTSGTTVNEHTALEVSTVYACVRIISETIASLPLHLYKRIPSGGKARAPDHPLYKVLHDEANEEMTSFSFWETMVGHLLTWGNAYAEIERDGRGNVVALWPLLPSSTTVERNFRDKKIYYRSIIEQTQTQVVLPAEKVLHIPAFGGDGRYGYSPIRMARETIGMAQATEEYGARFFGNGARPGGVLETDNTLKDEEAVKRLRRQWEEIYGGLSNSHRVAILEQGMKYKQVGLPPEDSQFLETRKFQKHEIAQLYRVPLHMLAETEKGASYASIEQFAIDFVVHTIRPWLVRIEQQICRKCLSKSEKIQYFAEFLVDGLLRGDVKSRSEALQIQRQNGIICANEWREIENMNPQPGEQGNLYLVNGAMIGIEQAAAGQKGGDSHGQGGKGTTVDPAAGEPSGDSGSGG